MTFRNAAKLTVAAAATAFAALTVSSAAFAQDATPAPPPAAQPAQAPAAPPAAPADTGPKIAWNFGGATDYIFRGVSQTNERAEAFAGVDITYNMFYVGSWTSNVDFENFGDSHTSQEVDLYGGIRPTLGPLSLDAGIYYYGYLGQSKSLPKVDYWEFYAKGTHAFGPVTLGASVFYSPQFTGHTGHAWYYEGNAAYTVNSKWSVSGAVGRQTIQFGTDYTTWNAGVTFSPTSNISLDLRYWDTNVNNIDAYKGRVVLLAKATF